jgi:hypothetical protein
VRLSVWSMAVRGVLAALSLGGLFRSPGCAPVGVALPAVAEAAAGRSGRPGDVGRGRGFLLRVDEPALAAAVGEGSVVRATLRVFVRAGRGEVAVARALRYWSDGDGDAVGGAPATVAPARAGWMAVDVTRDVQAFLAGAAPNYGWLFATGDPHGRAKLAGRTDRRGRAPVLALEVAAGGAPDVIRVAPDRWNFAHADGKRFVPVGFNYFGPRADALMEEVWDDDWAAIERDFRRMADLGANVVRVHLQFERFEPARGTTDEHALLKLDQLVRLARRAHVRLDVTGLGHYRAAAIQPWFAALDDDAMTDAEAVFWDAIARRYAADPTIFCWDLQNEPVVAYLDTDDVVGLPSASGMTFVNYHFRHVEARWRRWVRERHPDEDALRRAWGDYPLPGESWAAVALPQPVRDERRRADFLALMHALAHDWTHRMVAAIRASDRDHLVTIGFLHWSLPFHDLYSAFSPIALADELDFVAVHVYPVEAEGNTDYVELVVRAAWLGRPVVVEETDPALPDAAEDDFYRWTLGAASGWMSFYFGRLPGELVRSGALVDLLRAHRLARFRDFIRDEIPRAGLRRRPGTPVEVSLNELRDPARGRARRRAVLDRFAAEKARGGDVDVVYR